MVANPIGCHSSAKHTLPCVSCCEAAITQAVAARTGRAPPGGQEGRRRGGGCTELGRWDHGGWAEDGSDRVRRRVGLTQGWIGGA